MDFSKEEIDAMIDFMQTGRDREMPGRFDRLRALGLTGWENTMNERGRVLKQHVFEERRVTRREEEAVNRFEMLKPDSADRAAVEAELMLRGVGYRCSDGKVVLNGWGLEIDDRWRVANR